MSEVIIVAYHSLGFEVQFPGEPEKLEAQIAWLLAHGYRSHRGFQYTPDGLPICPRHGVPMLKREKQGDKWFSHNMGAAEDPIWCRGYSHTSSPGWDIREPAAAGNGSASNSR